ncbi:ATP-binding protein [Dokdonella sp.]|uniref:ATP-binding protein n=1 Tax=Dokdonella sp. TaxID=2291710 RepID=UPI0027B91312|nr:ATP-binding protein [Dokdonella sp.]
MTRFSLQRRLLLLLVGSALLVWVAMLVAGHDKARAEINELADVRLQQAARTLLVLDLKRLARLVQAGAAAMQAFDADRDDSVQPLAFQVWNDRGELLLASAGAPAIPDADADGYATRTIDGRAWRSYSLVDRHHAYRVTVLEPLDVREHPVRELTGRMGQVLLWSLPLLALLTWASIRRGLQPLARLSHALAARDAGRLEPLQVQRIPREVGTLVAALNDLLARLARSLDRERTFTADAAHELRTPLAAIKVQAEVALRATDEAARRTAIAQVIAAVNRTSHLAEQLLLLARLEYAPAGGQAHMDLAQLAADAIARHADAALRAGIELELNASAGSTLRGNAAMLSVLIDNLLDNAIQYGNHGGRAVVEVRPDGDVLLLRVADDGAGVAPDERERLRDRFFRGSDNRATGSGLGLSIVDRVAAAHHARVEFGSGLTPGSGFGVSVRFTPS